MNPGVRHRVVQSISLSLLKEETQKLAVEGWRPIGDPSLAVPVDLKRPPYWVQAMYLGDDAIALETHQVTPPAHSQISRSFGNSGLN